jgi:Asp-tRNA(Asn)/Glu-tRNA(Gln) amidotransferase A subunit family amidase
MDNLQKLSMREVANRIRSGRLSSTAYTQHLLARTDARDPQVQAWQWLDRDRAKALALEADLADSPRRAADLLHGVPIGVKDIIETAGIPTGMGCQAYADYIPPRSAEIVTRLESAGAFVIGKTVTTEAAFMVPSKTRNPWNTAHTPGGSSSGSAAAVACGMIPAALGTQTNGSVIRPAAFCGVVGYKPGFGQISTAGILPFSTTFDQPGVFARDVADAALLASCLTRQRRVISADVTTAKSPPRLAAVKSPVWHLAQSEQRVRFDKDIAKLRAAGASVDVVEIPLAFDRAVRVHRVIMLYEAARAARRVRAAYREKISAFLNDALDEGERTTDAQYRDALKIRTALQLSLAEFFDRGYSAIITPPAAGEAPASLAATGDPRFCTLWSLVGVPAISIPTGLGPRGLPLGLQIVAAAEEENYLLSTALWCERQLPFRGLDQEG